MLDNLIVATIERNNYLVSNPIELSRNETFVLFLSYATAKWLKSRVPVLRWIWSPYISISIY